MTYFDRYQHFNINRLLLLAIGLWPYQRTKLAQVQIILIICILSSFILLQFATFITAKCTPDLVTNILSVSFLFSIHLVKYSAFALKIKDVKYLLDQFEQIYNKLKDKKEITIIENYMLFVKRVTIIFILSAALYLIMINFMPMWPRVLGNFIHINDTRPRRVVMIINEYFLDQEKYFYFILLHTNATLYTGTLVIIAIAAMLVSYISHICGMFKIASYRIEQAMNINVSNDISPKDEIIIYKRIIYAVDMHREAMRFTNLILSTFESMFFCLLVFGVSLLSLNLFRVYQIVKFGGDIDEFMLHVAIVVTALIYIFLANYAAQEIMDHNDHVFERIYHIRWYVAPLHIQKIVLFLLQKGNKGLILKLGGIFVASLESASTLTSTSASYFTILCSTSQ